jgi:hypothetical protein
MPAQGNHYLLRITEEPPQVYLAVAFAVDTHLISPPQVGFLRRYSTMLCRPRHQGDHPCHRLALSRGLGRRRLRDLVVHSNQGRTRCTLMFVFIPTRGNLLFPSCRGLKYPPCVAVI